MLLELVRVVILNAITALIVPIVTNITVHVMMYYITVCEFVWFDIALFDGRYSVSILIGFFI